MNHLRTVQTRNVVVSNVMMSNAPKMTCPGDPRAQTHTQIVRAYLRYDRLGWAKCDGMAHSQVGWGG